MASTSIDRSVLAWDDPRYAACCTGASKYSFNPSCQGRKTFMPIAFRPAFSRTEYEGLRTLLGKSDGLATFRDGLRPESAKISFANSYQEQFPSEVAWYRPYASHSLSFTTCLATSTVEVGV